MDRREAYAQAIDIDAIESLLAVDAADRLFAAQKDKTAAEERLAAAEGKVWAAVAAWEAYCSSASFMPEMAMLSAAAIKVAEAAHRTERHEGDRVRAACDKAQEVAAQARARDRASSDVVAKFKRALDRHREERGVEEGRSWQEKVR